MLEISKYCLYASIALVALAAVAYITSLTTTRRNAQVATAGAQQATPVRGVAWYGSQLTVLAFILMTIALVCRTIVVKHAPFANQYEFACSFGWGMLAFYIYFERRHHARALGIALLPLALTMLVYAATRDDSVKPLVPALQSPFMLTVHVFLAVLGYGAGAVASAAGILYLVKPKVRWSGLPSLERLDELGYRAVVFSFPLLTMMNIQGAIWANTAWGRYWSWDPKETAAMVTWLIYGAYLHARVTKGWQGNRSAWLLILGFGAIIFTFLGNHFFGGLHSYGG
ncbi:c-type cytochrome biogenesis protein CcsB [Luteococcus sp. Sow4_B9]|uniref:c-type cytochrome biogenesis protein CcsB n=1 Tax=Luteococcus sp. Sow4_B9 TaxID=3438792 RepID=UPI003F974F94